MRLFTQVDTDVTMQFSAPWNCPERRSSTFVLPMRADLVNLIVFYRLFKITHFLNLIAMFSFLSIMVNKKLKY